MNRFTVLALLLGACGGDPTSPDAGDRDATTRFDSGARTDGAVDGSPSSDTGIEDAGIEDAGGEDAGIEDAGGEDAGGDGGPVTDAGGDASPADAGPLVNPMRFPGMQLWLSADTGVICASGTVVLWEDRSPMRQPVNPPSGFDGPQCDTGRTLNGLPVLYIPPRPAPVVSRNTLETNFGGIAGGPYSILVVVNKETDYGVLLSSFSATSPCASRRYFQLSFGRDAFFITGAIQTLHHCDGLTVRTGVTRVPDAGTPFASAAVFDPAVGRLLYVDGVLRDTNRAPGAMLPLLSVAGGRIGRGVGTTGFAGEIAEIIVYNRALSEADVAALQTYFAARWGI